MSVLKRYNEQFKMNEQLMITLKEMGNIYEIDYCSKPNTIPNITLIDKDHYVINKTGEVIDCKHIANRSENKFQVGQSLKRLRDLINTNVTIPKQWKWVTLTYAKNMRDTKQLYLDFDKFIKRLRYRYSNYRISYIIACEPQARGAWHIHLLLGFNDTAPFIPNATIEVLWGNGFTKTNKLDNIDNVGAYLTAYLGDMELTEDNYATLNQKGLKIAENDIKTITEIDGIKLKQPKSFIKGGRLYLYPPKFNLYRASRDMKTPTISKMPYYKAKEKIGCPIPIYKSCINVTDTTNSFSNTYYYEYYNKNRKIYK